MFIIKFYQVILIDTACKYVKCNNFKICNTGHWKAFVPTHWKNKLVRYLQWTPGLLDILHIEQCFYILKQ